MAGPVATLTVSDTGPGIDPRLADRVFEGVGHSAPAAPGAQGLGIGLPLAKQLVELHGGTIRLEHTAGPGATFVVTLPRAEDPSPTPTREAPAPVSAGR